MARIAIARSHHLSPQQLETLLEQVSEQLVAQYQLRCQYRPDGIHFSRSGAKGRLCAGHDSIELELQLGIFLKPFRNQIEQGINQQLDELLG